ncbi:unnamed protein product [Ceutorhynchus assimilis]|uniref:Uncharacterized protein n=1 Tax=Ceutorhynchus assimilis TaxID=467358 RepID=A0A9N9MJ00_9CUCU|nr:unnamed protein product [Ceutorhynchus assimilis]
MDGDFPEDDNTSENNAQEEAQERDGDNIPEYGCEKKKHKRIISWDEEKCGRKKKKKNESGVESEYDNVEDSDNGSSMKSAKQSKRSVYASSTSSTEESNAGENLTIEEGKEAQADKESIAKLTRAYKEANDSDDDDTDALDSMSLLERLKRARKSEKSKKPELSKSGKRRRGSSDEDDGSNEKSETDSDAEFEQMLQDAYGSNSESSHSNVAAPVKKRKTKRIEHQDYCTECNQGGEIILCDICPRAYHLVCLEPELDEVPEGKWRCPRCEKADLTDQDDEHEEFCKICQDGGELICCSSCPLSYHIHCLDPPLPEIPEGDWNCRRCACLPLKAKVASILTWKWIESKATNGKEEITQHRRREFFVKWKELSYWHCDWITQTQLEIFHPLILQCYIRKYDMEEPRKLEELIDESDARYTRLIRMGGRVNNHELEEKFYKYGVKPEWLIAHRILNHRTKEDGTALFLVKWRELSYDQATWEEESDVIPGLKAAIEYYKDLKQAYEQSKLCLKSKSKFKSKRSKVLSDGERVTAKRYKPPPDKPISKLEKKLNKQPIYLEETGMQLHEYQKLFCHIIEKISTELFIWLQIDKETDESNDVDDDTALQDMNPDSEEPQKTNDIQEPDETEEHHEIQKPHGTQQSHETHELRVTQEPNESQQTPKTRIRVSNKERKPPQMTHSIPNKKRAVEKLDAAFEILTKASNKEPPQDPSECQIFGNLVAKKLSKYSNVAQTAVQEAIMNILFAADKGYYNQYPAPRGYQSNNYSTIQSELVQRDSVYQDTQLIQSPYSPRPAAHWDFATDASSQAPQFSPVPLPLISPASASSQCSGMTNYSASTSNPPPFTSATLLTDLNLPDN